MGSGTASRGRTRIHTGTAGRSSVAASGCERPARAASNGSRLPKRIGSRWFGVVRRNRRQMGCTAAARLRDLRHECVCRGAVPCRSTGRRFGPRGWDGEKAFLAVSREVTV
jgi:hypothetical protein